MEDLDGGLLNIELSDNEEDTKKKADRTGQTEDEFQLVKDEYRVKVENGELYKSMQLPITSNTSKMALQALVHAVEELYFLKRYQDTLDFILKSYQDGGKEALDKDSIRILELCEARCREKLGHAS